jgi:SpoVK/Ycf46/Vps4 family AAA+-type ATPase
MIEEYIKEIESINYSCWQCNANDSYTASYKTIETLKRGYYTVDTSDDILYFHKKDINTDELFSFPDSKINQIIEEIDTFWDKQDIFKSLGFLHKRGYLLHGPAGGGKSCLIKLVIKNFINKYDGIVIEATTYPSNIRRALTTIRGIEPQRKVMCLYEDIDAHIKQYNESSVLSVLDGEDSFNHMLTIATTNYVQNLDLRIIARPRRFDRVIEIGMPDENIRRVYFQKKLKIEDTELEEYVNVSKEFSFAAMTELVVSVKCFDIELSKAAEILKNLLYKKKKDENNLQSDCVGF